MEQKTHSQKFLRQRKLLMVLPLLVLPFLTMMFWVLGGGGVYGVTAQQPQNGFNMQLPGANLKDEKPLDKLSYYEKAASDSMKMKQLMENDPYYRQQKIFDTSSPPKLDTSFMSLKNSNKMKTGSSILTQNSTLEDPNETKVYRKLAQLNTALNHASSSNANTNEEISTTKSSHNESVNNSDVDRLQQMMEGMNEKDGSDTEMQQLDGMLEKILDIQHPDRESDKIKQTSETKKGQVFTVAKNNNNSISLLDNRGTKSKAKNSKGSASFQSNNFYSIDDDTTLADSQNTIGAVVHQTQTLVEGSVVKLRLVNDVMINGVMIPKDNFVFGIADLNGERLKIKINSIRYRNALFPVSLSVYDMDGLSGIYIPGAITRDVAKQSADRATQAIDFTTLNPSIGAQAAGAGIEAAKTLFSRKIKLVKVTVKAGYQVLLHDDEQQQNN